MAMQGEACVYGVIPAAGASRRMGRPKQLLPVGGQPMLARVAQRIAEAGVAGVVVVVPSRLVDRLSFASPRVFTAINDDPASQMIDSVRIGLRFWRSRLPAGPRAGFLVTPGDQAGLTASDAARCVEAFIETPEQIIIASFAGRRGHPIVFPATLASFVASPACDGGLNRLAQSHEHRVRTVACDDPGTLDNINTPRDYGRLG